MKNLIKLGTILSKSDQLLINGGENFFEAACPSCVSDLECPGRGCDICTDGTCVKFIPPEEDSFTNI